MEQGYDYELTYKDKDMVSTTKFSAMITLDDLKDHLRTFLISAGWSAEQVSFLNGEDEAYEMQKEIDKLEAELQRYKDTIAELQGDKKDEATDIEW